MEQASQGIYDVDDCPIKKNKKYSCQMSPHTVIHLDKAELIFNNPVLTRLSL